MMIRTKKTLIQGDGPLNARIMIVGEAPSKIEIERSLPFVGPAGQLLNQALEVLSVPRTSLYVTNLVKVRLTDDNGTHRTATIREVEVWSGELLAEIDWIKPDLIVTLGKTSTQWTLGEDITMGNVVGKQFTFGEAKVVPAWDPSFVRISPALFDVWVKQLTVMKEYI